MIPVSFRVLRRHNCVFAVRAMGEMERDDGISLLRLEIEIPLNDDGNDYEDILWVVVPNGVKGCGVQR